MVEVELIGVPFDGWGRPGNQTLAAGALRGVGLVEALARYCTTSDAGDLPLPDPVTERAPGSGLVNEPALLAATDQLRERLGRSIGLGRFVVVVGGDCSALLGIVAGACDAVPHMGLVFVDGHEDSTPLDVSEDGEAANTEIGLLLGLTGTTAPDALRRRVVRLDRGVLAVLGPRDDEWRRRANVGSLSDVGVWVRPSAAVAAAPTGTGRDAVRHLIEQGVEGWWLHVDLDVLDPEVFVAQGVPGDDGEPGGLSWPQLRDVLVAAVREGGCLGWSITIYDPEQDPTGHDARNIVDLVRAVAQYLP